MSEDRTQPASKRRLQMAREQGQVPHSPELTAAGGWLVALLVLGFWGQDLMAGLVGLVRQSAGPERAILSDADSLVTHVHAAALAVAVPLGLVGIGFAAGALATHQMQVRGLWAVGLVAPDFSRLWAVGRGAGSSAGVERFAWAAVKAVVLVGVSCWVMSAEWTAIQRLGSLKFPALAIAAGRLLIRPVQVLGGAMLVLGLCDFGLRHFRYEAMLRTTPEEQREDLRVMEGDPSLRARRRRMARAWRGDAPELLAGASLVLIGKDGLTVVLAGGPPPRRVSVRHVAQGTTGQGLRRSAISTRLPQVDAAELARGVARHVATQGALASNLPAELQSELAKVWPARES